MAFLQKENEALDPVNVGLFGAESLCMGPLDVFFFFQYTALCYCNSVITLDSRMLYVKNDVIHPIVGRIFIVSDHE